MQHLHQLHFSAIFINNRYSTTTNITLPFFNLTTHRLRRHYRSFSSPFRALNMAESSKKEHNHAIINGVSSSSSSSSSTAPLHKQGNWYSVPELSLRDHYFSVPLDHHVPNSSSKITVFAREVVAVGNEVKELPYLLFLQGGPGFEAPRPTEANGWLKKASTQFRIVLLDQRGTGLSTPLTVTSLCQINSPAEQVEYLKHFRADNIVNDAEFIRVRLVPKEEPWSVLGQSYGGFCAVTYLSFAPHGLRHVLLTGGLPPVGEACTADVVYRACFQQVLQQNERYYKRFPEDVDRVREVVDYLGQCEGGGVPLPSGGILTPRGLQLLGLSGLGVSAGFERLHYMFERVWDPVLVEGASKCISYSFLRAYEHWLDFDKNPLYALLHESIYCQGASSGWSAQRISDEHRCKFDAVNAVKEDRPVLFFGEMIFPWMFEEIHALRPLREVANLLAFKEDWPSLYDTDVLKNNQVPVAASVYHDDMYVNYKLAMDTASQIAGIRLWITNEHLHSGLRDNGAKVFDYLMGMLTGMKPLV